MAAALPAKWAGPSGNAAGAGCRAAGCRAASSASATQSLLLPSQGERLTPDRVSLITVTILHFSPGIRAWSCCSLSLSLSLVFVAAAVKLRSRIDARLKKLQEARAPGSALPGEGPSHMLPQESSSDSLSLPMGQSTRSAHQGESRGGKTGEKNQILLIFYQNCCLCRDHFGHDAQPLQALQYLLLNFAFTNRQIQETMV